MFTKSRARIISDALCGVLMLLGILAFVLIGIFTHVWHPTWVILIVIAIIDAIISIIVNSYVSLHKTKAHNDSEN